MVGSVLQTIRLSARLGLEVFPAKPGETSQFPPELKVKLELKETGVKETSWITKLKPDDLYEVFIFPQPENEKSFKFGDAQLRHLGHLTGLKELTIQFVQVTGRGLQYLEPLQELEKLIFYSPNLGNDGLKSIGKLKSLQTLSIGVAKWDDAGLAHLANLNSLEEIQLPFSGVPGRGFDAVVQLPNLKYIAGSMHFNNAHLGRLKKSNALRALVLQQNEKIDDNSLRYIAQVPQLEYLDLWHTNISDAGVRHLRPLKSLKRLNIKANRQPSGPTITSASADVLSQLTSLEILDVGGVGGVNEFLEGISTLKNLKSLSLSGERDTGFISDTGMKSVSKLRSLERLTVSGTAITDVSADHLAQLTGLKWLVLFADDMSDEGLAKLTALKKLQYLNILGNPKRGKFTFSGVSRLNGLPNLTELWYYGLKPRPDEPGLDFTGMPQLQKLGMADLRDEDMAGLRNCKNLKWLQGSHLSNAGVAQLADFHLMERLTLSGNEITDDGLKHLAGMNRLNWLTIEGRITDAGLRHLEDKKSIERLTIKSTEQLSSGALQRLFNELPNLRGFTINDNQAKRVVNKNAQQQGLKVGAAAPPFKVRTLKRKALSLDDYKGKVLLLHFWSSSKKSDVAEIPKLIEASNALKKFKDFQLISLAVEDEDYALRQFVRQQKMTWPQVRLSKDSKVISDYAVTQNPTYILIGRDGKILHVGGTGLEAALITVLDIGDGVTD